MSRIESLIGLSKRGEISTFTPLRVAYPSTVAKASFPQVPGSDQMVKYNVKGTEADGALPASVSSSCFRGTWSAGEPRS